MKLEQQKNAFFSFYFKLSLGEVTLAVRLLQYKNRNGLTYENRPCDTRLEHDINRDGRCDTGFLFCLVPLPFQNPHNCTLGDHFTGFVGADEIFFVNVEPRHESSSWALAKKKQRSSSFVSLWFQPTIYFRFPYPKVKFSVFFSSKFQNWGKKNFSFRFRRASDWSLKFSILMMLIIKRFTTQSISMDELCWI